MLEDFSPPPSSPLGGAAGAGVAPAGAQDGSKLHNSKASSVMWCTDYLEVMGCEKPHNFKVCLELCRGFLLLFSIAA
jgi:hypothetical protein